MIHSFFRDRSMPHSTADRVDTDSSRRTQSPPTLTLVSIQNERRLTRNYFPSRPTVPPLNPQIWFRAANINSRETYASLISNRVYFYKDTEHRVVPQFERAKNIPLVELPPGESLLIIYQLGNYIEEVREELEKNNDNPAYRTWATNTINSRKTLEHRTWYKRAHPSKMTHDGNITAPTTSYLIPLIRRLDHKEFYLFSGRQPERNILEDRSKEESNKTSIETTVMQLPDTGRIRSRRRTRPSLTVQEQLNTNPLTNYIRKRGIRASNNRESSTSSSNSSGRQRQRSTTTRRSSRIASVKIKRRPSRNASLQMKPRAENEKSLLPKETEDEINDTVIAEGTEHPTKEDKTKGAHDKRKGPRGRPQGSLG